MRPRLRAVDIVLVDDAAISSLAARFRKSPGATDVLAFHYENGALSGEIAISLDTAKRQAKERGHTLSDELKLLCIHGLLHISGRDDENLGDWLGMRKLEFESLITVL